MTRTRRKRARARRRLATGAIFVEALIVISSFVLMLIGLIFFHRLYTTSLALRRLSRGAAIAYSMGGCQNNEPRAWLGRDLADYTTPGSPTQQNSSTGVSNATPSGTDEGSVKATELMNGNDQLQDGTAVNPLVVAEVSGRASTSVRRGAFGTTTAIFEKDLTGRATISCGDIVRSGSYSEVIDQVRDMMDF